MTKVFIDLTEFLGSHDRTGIQRVCGELCRFWPESRTLTPVKLTKDHRLVALPKAALGLIRDYFDASASSLASLKSQLADMSTQAESSGERIHLQEDCRVLVPELFYDPSRVSFFRGLSPDEFNHFYFIIYDLLPFTHPEFFRANPPQEILNGYTHVVRTARNVAFISNWTKEMYYRRLLRIEPRDGPVLRLGSDGLGGRPNAPLSRGPRPKFTVLGTIEPRKNHALILDVFEPLLRQIDGLQLVFLGQIGWADSTLAERVQRLAASCPGFEHHSSPNDELIRKHVLESWATIYMSGAEGFGLPPVESLWLGTPVIASAAIPGLEATGSLGVHIVEPLNSVKLSEAALAFLEGPYADCKREEAMSLSLPTWRSFALEVAEWCTQEHPRNSSV